MIRYHLIKQILNYLKGKIDDLETLHIDAADFQELPIYEILHNAGIDCDLSIDELGIIDEELRQRADNAQTAEICSIYAE